MFITYKDIVLIFYKSVLVILGELLSVSVVLASKEYDEILTLC